MAFGLLMGLINTEHWTWASKLLCNLNYLRWTWCYLITEPLSCACTAELCHQMEVIYRWKIRSQNVLKTQARYIKMCPNTHDPQFCYTIISLPVCTYGLMGNSLWSVDRETENSGLVFAWYAGTTGKSTAVALQLLSEISLKDYHERKSCKKTELQELHLLIVCLGIKMTRYAVIRILIHGLWPMVWLDDQEFIIKND